MCYVRLTQRERLCWVRKEAAREEHEDAHCGGYARVFPCLDKIQHERYSHCVTVGGAIALLLVFKQGFTAPVMST